MPVNYVIIVAGGVGSRMNNSLPKQFIKLDGKEIVVHAIKKFIQFDSDIKTIIVVHKTYMGLMEEIISAHAFKNIQVTEGGDTRFQSVKNGLEMVNDENAIVGIHDAARPFVSLQTIKNCYSIAAEKGNATPSVPINETIRENIDGRNKMANRNNFRIIQTPQCFLVSKIKKAFELPYSESFTDDATVLEADGEKINLVEGNPENIKITNPHDLIIAKSLLENEQR